MKPYTYIFIFYLLFLFGCRSQTLLVAPPSDVRNENLDTLVVRATKLDRSAHVFTGAYKPSATRKADLLHTKLDLRFNLKKREVTGVATLDLKPYFYPIEAVELDAVNFNVRSVKLMVNGKEKPLKFNNENRKLTVFLDRLYSREEEIKIEIDYLARPEIDSREQAYAIGSDQGMFFIDPDETDPSKPTQIWTQGETSYNSRWFPTFDSPNERCTQELIVTVDKRFKTLSNGVLLRSTLNKDDTRTDHWKMDLPHAPYLFSLVVGDYAVSKEMWRNKEVSYYVYPEYSEHAKKIFDRTPEMLEFFSKITGVDYPWPKYSQVIVSDFVSGAMENTTAVTFSESFLKSSEELVDFPNDMIVAHEMFHHWFGDYVTCESWANTALNEGFANYAEYLWVEHVKGYVEAEFYRQSEMNQYLNSAKYQTHDLIHFEHEDNDGMFDAHSYNKGGLILHMLRKYLGDEAFFEGLKKYLTDNAFSAVEAHDLRLAYESVSGEDLNWFFDQWFFDKGHPELEADYTYMDEENKLLVQIDQVQQIDKHREVFRFPFEYQLIFADGSIQTEKVWIDQRSSQFELSIDEEPVVVLFNSNKELLCTVSIEYTSEQEAVIFESRVHDVFRLNALQNLKYIPAYNQYFESALFDPASKIRKLGIESVSSPLSESNLSRISELVVSDPEPLQRARALRVLIREDKQLPESFILQILDNDGSASVIALCLDWLAKNNMDQAMIAASKFTNSKAGLIEAGVSEILAESGDPAHLEYFKERLFSKGVFQLVPMLNSYNKLLEKQDPAVIYEYCDWLYQTARKTSVSTYKARLFDQSIRYQINALKRRSSNGYGGTDTFKKQIRELGKMLSDQGF